MPKDDTRNPGSPAELNAALARAQEWRSLFDAVRDPIFVHDRDFRIVRANLAYAARAGKDIREIVGKRYWEVFPKDAGPLTSCRHALTRTEAEAEEAEEEVKLATGETFVSRAFSVRDAGSRHLYSVHILEDITERRRAEASLRRLNRALRTLSACNSTLVHAENETKLLADMCRVTVEVGGYRMAWTGAVEHDEAKSIRPTAYAGVETGYLESLNITWADTERGRGPTGRAVRTGRPEITQNILTAPDFSPWRDEALKRGYASNITLPLCEENGEVFGTLGIYAAEPDAFDVDETALLTELSEDLAFGILTLRTRRERSQLQEERLRTGERLKRALVGTIQAVALTVEKRDPYTAGHQGRVAQLCIAVGRELGWEPERIEGMRLGALIHDIGKISVPAEILNRPGRLSAPEFEIIRSHPEVGYDIVKDVQFPWPVAQMIRQHHERLDGSGYPAGLKGGQIIPEARILAVADVVEAIASHRPYRPARGLEAALEEVEKNRDRYYDPAAVDACLRLFREKGFCFEAVD